jgi:ATP/ADP translocase
VGFLHINNIITSTMAFTLPEQMVRTVGIFQGLLALPVLLFTAAVALQALAYAYDYVYEFT